MMERFSGWKNAVYRRRLRALLKVAGIGATAELFMIMKELQSPQTADPS
jgi:hypothetical protein